MDDQTNDTPVPMENIGNSCFMNAALQLLWTAFPNVVEETRTIDAEAGTEEAEEHRPLLALLMRLYRPSAEKNRSRKVKNDACSLLLAVKELVAAKFPRFRQADEEADSHEFLKCTLDVLHDELNQGLGEAMEGKDLQGKRKRESDKAAEDRWRSWRHARDNSAIVNLFSGAQKTVVTCLRCTQKSYNFDPIGGLHVELPQTTLPSKKKSVKGVVQLDEDLVSRIERPDSCFVDGYVCEQCNEGSRTKIFSRVEKTTVITSLPEFLIVHIKRFLADGETKNTSRVEVPRRMTLDRTPYQLRGLISHCGERLHTGHYVATVVNLETDRAFLCDDETITAVEDPFRHSVGDAYVVMYSRDSAND